MSDEIFVDAESDEAKSEKPRRRRRRRKVEEEQKQDEKRLVELAQQAGVASANIANQIAIHLPQKFFERKPLTNDEAEGIASCVSTLVQNAGDEQAAKFAKTFPIVALATVCAIAILSRLKVKREGTNTDLREGRVGENNSSEKNRSETIEEAQR